MTRSAPIAAAEAADGPQPVSIHEALIYAMIAMSAVDARMSDMEMFKIGDIVAVLPIFAGFDRNRLPAVAADVTRILDEDEDGLDRLLDAIADALPAKLHDTAYALAVEVAAVDLAVGQEELRLLDLLRDRLDLDKLTVAAIERSAKARYRTP